MKLTSVLETNKYLAHSLGSNLNKSFRGICMAKNIDEGRHADAVKGRSRAYNAKTDKWVKYDENHKITKNNSLRTGFKGKGKQMI